jgi:Antitoxin to bacterial toxin RNase LS or RnlA
MDTKELYQIEKISDRIVVVFSTTYVNPISYLPTIEEDLCEMDSSGKIIFDLLLSNGHSFNRFVEGAVCKGKVDRRSMKVVDSSSLDNIIISKTDDFYKAHPLLVESNHILLDEEKHNLMCV